MSSVSSNPGPGPDVKILRDLQYRDEPGMTEAQRARCRLDLYLPTNARGFPLVVWFHGGGLTFGDKNSPVEVAVGTRLARDGVGVAMATYRFAPEARFPDFPRDAAAACACLLRHGPAHGGDPNRLILSGYSAGAYITALIGMDASYLREAGIDEKQVAGVIPISGQVVTHFTIRGQNGVPDYVTRPVIDVAAPCYHARKDAAPTLLIAGSHDMPMRMDENRYFAALLRSLGHPDAQYLEFPGRDHGTIADRMHLADDPVYAAFIHFIRRCASRVAHA